MEIQTRNLIDIERYTNDIRKSLLTGIAEYYSQFPLAGDEEENVIALVERKFDQATTKALFNHITQEPPADALFRDKLHGAGTQASLSGAKKPGPKAGSTAARKRAQKAAATRASNKAARTPATEADSAHRDSEAHGRDGGWDKPAAPTTAGAPAKPATGFGGMPSSTAGGGL